MSAALPPDIRAPGGLFGHRLEDKPIHLDSQSLGNQNAIKRVEEPLHNER
jgi:hypothetical protein